MAKIELARAELEAAKHERIEMARMELEGRTLNARPPNKEISNIELAKYLQYVPKFSTLDPEDFFYCWKKMPKTMNFQRIKWH